MIGIQKSPLVRLRHPALAQLLRFQTTAKLSRLTHSFRNPRKKVLSILAILLGLVWLSQTILSILFRESADPEQLAYWLPLSLLAYCIWHVLKISTQQVVEPFEWTAAEKELVIAAPVSRPQQVTYRMTTIAAAALVKAICFSIVMSPDIQCWPAAILGMFLGLAFVDLVRVNYELFFYGLATVGRNVCRAIVVGSVVGCAGLALIKCLLAPSVTEKLSSPAGLAFFISFFWEIVGYGKTPIGMFLSSPFTVFTNLTLVDGFNGTFSFGGLMGTGLVGLNLMSVYRIDRWTQRNRHAIERAALKVAEQNRLQGTERAASSAAKNVWVPFRWRGVGSLMWRQVQTVYNYRSTILFSLGLPVLLSCLPLLTNHGQGWMLLNLVGSLIFYSFLLLPSALILDYRRDINRMAVLKALPIHPFAVTVGQLATPVLICSMFQLLVLTIAFIAGKVIFWQAAISIVLMVPINVLIFSLENYIFLLSPYQRNKEGFDVFIRTILTFTGKGLVFGIAAALILMWITIVFSAGRQFGCSQIVSTGVFVAGIVALTTGITAVVLHAITRRFERFDPSQDVPAVG